MEITKLDAAHRLLTEAIRGRLRGDDPLGVHLMTCSAMRITADLRKAQGLGQSPFDHVLTDEGRRVLWRSFYSLNSFVKHADRDADATHDIANVERMNEIALVMAIDNLRTLRPRTLGDFWMSYYFTKFVVENPASIDADANRAWLDIVVPLWPELPHDYVIEMARDTGRHREELDRLAGSIPALPPQPPAPADEDDAEGEGRTADS